MYLIREGDLERCSLNPRPRTPSLKLQTINPNTCPLILDPERLSPSHELRTPDPKTQNPNLKPQNPDAELALKHPMFDARNMLASHEANSEAQHLDPET